MNFGPLGVVAFASIGGWILGSLESVFFHGVVRRSISEYPESYAASWLPYVVFTVSIASSATYNLYTLAALSVVVAVMNALKSGMAVGLESSNRLAHRAR